MRGLGGGACSKVSARRMMPHPADRAAEAEGDPRYEEHGHSGKPDRQAPPQAARTKARPKGESPAGGQAQEPEAHQGDTGGGGGGRRGAAGGRPPPPPAARKP